MNQRIIEIAMLGLCLLLGPSAQAEQESARASDYAEHRQTLLQLASGFVMHHPIGVTEGTSPELIVNIGGQETLLIAGFAAIDEVAERLRASGRQPIKVAGKTPIVISLTHNWNVSGCGCPQEFKDFFVMYLAKTSVPGSFEFVPDFMVTNHPVRRLSMATKFGGAMNLGQITMTPSSAKVLSPTNTTLVEVKLSRGWSLPIPVSVDLVLRSMGGQFAELGNLQPLLYHAGGDYQFRFHTFLSRWNSLRFDQAHEVGAFLARANFRPLVWAEGQGANLKSWVPPQ